MRSKKKARVRRNERKSRMKGLRYVAIALSIVVILMLASLFVIFYNLNTKIEKQIQAQQQQVVLKKQPLFNSTEATTRLAAVDNNGTGVLTLLVVEAVPGSGRTMVDIDNLLFWGDTQHSIRIAKNVAAEITQVDTNKYDLVYNIYANASVIGGESAGAALTLATIAALENKSLREDVVITGTINHDGTIGPVQGIIPKAKAAAADNATMFLVPMLQGSEITYEQRKYCEKYGATEYCTVEQVPRRVNISQETGIQVIEVPNISEAMKYFFSQ